MQGVANVNKYNNFKTSLMRLFMFSRSFSFYHSPRRQKLMSNTFRFPDPIPKEKKLQNVSASKSFKLMMTQGYIKSISPGIFILMDPALRTVQKLCQLVDDVMTSPVVHGEKVEFPKLIPRSFFDKSGRWENNENLIKLKDRHKAEYCLGPTHEEIATHLFAKKTISYKSLPLRLYQISTKFRDEMNPRLGFLRSREFLMKDMYTFDSSIENAEKTYEEVCEAYLKMFNHLGIEVIKAKGSSGDIGGDSSHEFHIISDVGEDIIFYCSQCKTGINSELVGEKSDLLCNICNSKYQKANAIEVGHAFLLGTTYSKKFEAEFDNPSHKHELLQMGCYGLGITRIIAACMEQLSTPENIRLPLKIVPYLLCFIIPKKGSKEESVLTFALDLFTSLSHIRDIGSDIIFDDRTHLTIGKRVQEATACGIPYIIVVGSSAMNEIPKIEVIDVYNSETLFLTHKEVLDYFKQISSKSIS